MTASSNGAGHPARHPQTEAALDARQVAWRFEANLAVDQIVDLEGNQVRLDKHRAPRDQVAKYATAMKHGATFPAIVVNENSELVDGNTRWAAAKKVKRVSVPAYICSGLTPLLARSLSVELNQTNGLHMEPEELRNFVESAVDADQQTDKKTLARMTGAKPETIALWVSAREFRGRALRHGFTDEAIQQLRDRDRVSLGVAKLRSVFTEISRLAIDARLNGSAIKGLVRDANNAPSEDAALAIVAAAREERTEDIKRIAAGFTPHIRRSKGSEAHIGGLLRFGAEDLLDVAPERRAVVLERLRDLHTTLGSAIAQADERWPDDKSEAS